MARTAVTVTTLSPTASVARPAGTSADPTNDHIISGVPLEELVVEITQTDTSAHTATIVAGANPPALASGQGTIALSMAQNDVALFGPFESGRFAQTDGSLHIDLAASFAGTIRAYQVPRTA